MTMEKTLKFTSWVMAVLGALAVLGSFADEEFYGLFGGLLFLVQGVLTLSYMKSISPRE